MLGHCWRFSLGVFRTRNGLLDTAVRHSLDEHLHGCVLRAAPLLSVSPQVPSSALPSNVHKLAFTHLSGHISARRLVHAQTVAAMKLGCQRFSWEAVRVDPDPGQGYTVHLESGAQVPSVCGRRVLVCCGAFSNARPLLPAGIDGNVVQLDLTCRTAVTAHCVLEEHDAARLAGAGRDRGRCRPENS